VSRGREITVASTSASRGLEVLPDDQAAVTAVPGQISAACAAHVPTLAEVTEVAKECTIQAGWVPVEQDRRWQLAAYQNTPLAARQR
jgi:hypothetical protein